MAQQEQHCDSMYILKIFRPFCVWLRLEVATLLWPLLGWRPFANFFVKITTILPLAYCGCCDRGLDKIDLI